jgi:hypothetical protein
MDYYLIIGYTTYEKFKNFGKIQLFVDDFLIDEFEADNEKKNRHSSILPLGRTIKADTDARSGDVYYFDVPHDPDHIFPVKIEFDHPQKFKIIKIDSKSLIDKKTLELKIKSGPSNYTNGFVTKSNLIQIFPIFLIPKFCLDNDDINKTFFNKNKKFFYNEVRKKSFIVSNIRASHSISSFPHPMLDRDLLREIEVYTDTNIEGILKEQSKKIQWPGPNIVSVTQDGKSKTVLLGEKIGGDFEIKLYIHKKHQIYFLHNHETTPKGWFWLNYIWHCLIDDFKKIKKTNS